MKQKAIPRLAGIVFLIGLSCKKSKDVDPPPPAPEKKWIVTTIAGNGTASFVNGPVQSATFHFPEDVAVTNSGIVYVTDVVNKVIRKIANGEVSTSAGGAGFDIINGNGPAAAFKSPYGIAMDANNNLYTTDDNDPRIRKISSANDVSVYSGSDMPGFFDGDAATSRFSAGAYLVADAAGILYVSDGINNRIRKISLSGQVTTIAGSGIAGFKDDNGIASQFSFPGGITIDKDGNLYIADRGNFRIRKISATGNTSTIAGGTQGNKDGKGGDAQFSQDMRDLVADGQGNLYLSDDNRIRKIDAQGTVSTIAGGISGFQDGDGTAAKFNYPNGLAIDSQGRIYVADLNNNRIRRISFE